MTMGTASTMAIATEALGLSLPGAASIPAVDSSHSRLATASGRRIVEMVLEDQKPRDVLTAQAFDNAIRVVMAVGGSTNALIHLVAMAGRAGVELALDRFDALSRTTPRLANIRPSGEYLMEDFHYAGRAARPDGPAQRPAALEAATVAGGTLRESLEGALVHNDAVIATREKPLAAEGGLAVLRGNLAPDGAVIKHSAMEARLQRHAGPAIVFRDYNDLERRIDDPALGATPDSVLVLQNAGPLGGPGMPEWGMLPIPKPLLQQGVRDMLRISDARMSGTSYGACVLHVAPESFVGGPLALVKDGDVIELDVDARRLALRVSDDGAGAPPGAVDAARRSRTRAATARSTHATSRRPTRAATSTSCRGRRPVPEPEIH